jgi:hypothetical protein
MEFVFRSGICKAEFYTQILKRCGHRINFQLAGGLKIITVKKLQTMKVAEV